MAKVNVDTQHSQYAVYSPEWQLIADCVAGERAVKAADYTYLPHPSAKPEKDPLRRRYNNYKLRAAFLNATGRTLDAMLGIAFNKPVKLTLTGALKPLENDANGMGVPATQLLRGALAEALKTGRFGFLVDTLHGVRFDTETGVLVKPTAEQAAGNRPIIRLFEAPQIINWLRDELIVLKYQEDFASADVDDFQVYPVTIWVELRKINGKAFCRKWYYNSATASVKLADGLPEGWSKTELLPVLIKGEHANDLPFAWGGSIDNNSDVDPAPLADIASLNIKHYMTEADVAESAHIASIPTLVISGLTQVWVDKNMKEGIGLGATKGIKLPENGKAELLQAEDRNGSVELCERREKQMAMLGAALIERGSAPKTATEADYDAQTDNSILALCAGNVERAFNRALELAQGIVGGTGNVVLNKFFSNVVVDSQTLTALMAGVQGGTIRLGDLIKWMMGQGIIDDSQTVEEVEDELRNQNPLPSMIVPPAADPNADPNADTSTDNEEDA